MYSILAVTVVTIGGTMIWAFYDFNAFIARINKQQNDSAYEVYLDEHLNGDKSSATEEVTDANEDEVIDLNINDDPVREDATQSINNDVDEAEIEVDTAKAEDKATYDNWVDAYTALLSDHSNFEVWLSSKIDYGHAWYPSAITGFTLYDLAGDNIPELLILFQPVADNYYRGDYATIFVVGFDDESKTLVNYNPNDSWEKDSFHVEMVCAGYYSEHEAEPDSYMINTIDKYDWVPGIAKDGKIILLQNQSTVSSDPFFYILTYDYKTDEFETVCGEYYSEDGSGIVTYGDMSYLDEIVDNYTPFMFFDICDDNIEKYVNADYLSTDIYDYTAEEVMQMYIKNGSEICNINTDGLAVDGTIENIVPVNYNIDGLIQWYAY